MRRSYIYELGARRLPPSIGRKAENLRFMIRRGVRVPNSFVCVWEAHQRYLEGDTELARALRSELLAKLDDGLLYAVRSSANIEDGREHSFAGQLKTVLDLQGADSILRAMYSIWEASLEPGVGAYLEKSGVDPSDLRMAVVIQEMVQPYLSGVSFSKNPLTGLDEVIVEAVPGSGEALVQDGVTPQRWINKWGSWISRPDAQHEDAELIEEVVRQTRAIAKMYGHPVDLEWVHDGRTLNWVQLREITTLDVPLYSNRISREVFPGIIKPLVWSINVPLVNEAWVRLLTELTGPLDIDPESLAALFYYRAYFNMGTFGQILERLGLPRESLELILGIETEGPEKPVFKPTSRTYSHLPRMMAFALDKLRFAGRLDRCLPEKKARFRAFDRPTLAGMDEGELLEAIDNLFLEAQEMAYYNIVTPLLMHLYNRALKGQLERAGLDMGSLDVTSRMEELRQFEPGAHLAELRDRYNELDPVVQEQIAGLSYDRFCNLQGIASFQKEVSEFIERFGHLSDSGNDFTSVPWRENPDLVLRMIVDYLPAKAGAGHKKTLGELRLPALRRMLVKPVYGRARAFRLYREAVSSLYTYGYGLFRNYFLALGDQLAQREAIVSQDDVFCLYYDEVREIVRDRGKRSQYQDLIEKRRREIDQVRDVELPSVIFGDQEPAIHTPTGDRLVGTPTSGGLHTGRVKVLRGLEEFDKLDLGDVLVIPYSDVGWTPLFARAGAVVAESGGLLSHSSIVAREYGIPAVVSVPGACRLPDDSIVTVDGYQGEIMVHDAPEKQQALRKGSS